MFSTKKKTLFDSAPVGAKEFVPDSSNPFIIAGLKKSAETRSGNYSLKFSTTGNDFLDQFSNLGVYRKPRKFADISLDCDILWASNPELTVRFIMYLRIISRKVTLFNGEKTQKVQKGGGLKYESIMRMMWLHMNHPEVFWKNITLFVSLGSWKDIFQMLTYDLEYNGWDGRVLDWNKMADLLKVAATNSHHVDLFKKYIPQIRAKSACKTLRAQARTITAKWLASVFDLSYKKYRLLKVSGNAHKWQQLISRKKFKQIDFGSIHGRALLQLVSSKFLANQKLIKLYEEWIAKQPIAKFTGYVHELAKKITPSLQKHQINTLNKQYDGLVELAKKDGKLLSKFIVVRDTSGSMSAPIPGEKISSGNVAKALGIYFGDLLEGPFKNAWIEFHSVAKLHVYKTSTFVSKWNKERVGFVGSTNFLSVIDLLCNLRKKIDEKHFPTGILCISDGEFDPGDLGKTNVDSAMERLKNGGFSQEYIDNFQIVLWNIPNSYYGGKSSVKFETFGHHKNIFYISGYDGSVISFLMGTEETVGQPTVSTAEELFAAAMNQESLNLVDV